MTTVFQEYPKWLAEGVIVNNAEEEKAALARLQDQKVSPSAEVPSETADGGAVPIPAAPSVPEKKGRKKKGE